MDARLLRAFFAGEIPASELAADLRGAFETTGRDTRRLRMADLPPEEAFQVETRHLVRLCDAVLAGDLPPAALEAVGFGLIASDGFEWDGDIPDGMRVAETLYDWSAPEINYALRPDTVAKFRHFLLTGEATFTRGDLASASA